MLVIRTEIHKMLVRTGNREDFDQKRSGLGLHCLPMPFRTLLFDYCPRYQPEAPSWLRIHDLPLSVWAFRYHPLVS